MAATDAITQARLKELLHYDPDTGIFTWLTRAAQSVHIGDVAGSVSHGYTVIRIDYSLYKAHRLAFLYMLSWMPDEVDHDDQVKDNNRWKNLNPVTHTKNMKNLPLLCTNTSGHCGVVWHKRDKKWRAQIKVDGKYIFLGRFTDKADAIAARQAADIKYGFHENHGNKLGLTEATI